MKKSTVFGMLALLAVLLGLFCACDKDIVIGEDEPIGAEYNWNEKPTEFYCETEEKESGAVVLTMLNAVSDAPEEGELSKAEEFCKKYGLDISELLSSDDVKVQAEKVQERFEIITVTKLQGSTSRNLPRYNVKGIVRVLSGDEKFVVRIIHGEHALYDDAYKTGGTAIFTDGEESLEQFSTGGKGVNYSVTKEQISKESFERAECLYNVIAEMGAAVQVKVYTVNGVYASSPVTVNEYRYK